MLCREEQVGNILKKSEMILAVIDMAVLLFFLLFIWSYVVPDQPLTVSATETVELGYFDERMEVEIPEDYIQLPTVRCNITIRISQFIEEDMAAQQIADWIMTNRGDYDDWFKATTAAYIVVQNIEYADD